MKILQFWVFSIIWIVTGNYKELLFLRGCFSWGPAHQTVKQGFWLCLTRGYRVCGIPHLAVVSDIHFPEQSKGAIFTLTSMADQITLMTVTDQITPAAMHCSPVRRGECREGKGLTGKSIQKGLGEVGWGRKKANESFLITKCPAWVYQQHHGGGGERDIPWVTINRK